MEIVDSANGKFLKYHTVYLQMFFRSFLDDMPAYAQPTHFIFGHLIFHRTKKSSAQVVRSRTFHLTIILKT